MYYVLGLGLFLQARVTECGTHAPAATAIGAMLALGLLHSLDPGKLVPADRGFYSPGLWPEAAAVGTQLLWRVRARPVLRPHQEIQMSLDDMQPEDVVDEEVLYQIADYVATITINRPHRRNAINSATNERLLQLFDDALADPGVRVIVLTGSGDRAFCSGADLKELDSVARSGKQVPTPMTGSSRNVFEALLETYKPTIAALNGPAVAGGCELALACDLRIASEHAFLGLPEARRGMGANFASVVLPRLLPRAVALEMLYTGVHMDAATAAGWGLYNRTVPADRLRDAVADVAGTIAANAPLTVRRYKEMAVKGWELSVHSALRLNVGPNPYSSRDREEGVRAYLEGRQPQWEGR